MITDTRTVENGYRGLDSARDTEAEVATMLRFFPTQLLSQQRHWHSLYPIQCLPAFMWCNNDTYLSNLKTEPFLHIFSAIAIECDKFEENQRGGFLVEDTFGQMPKIRKSLSNASRKQITDIVKTTLATSTIKLNMVEALVLAATDDTIHLGGKYFCSEEIRNFSYACIR